MKNFSIALLHYPVLNKKGQIVTSSVSNMDIHDIARTACTYGLDKYFIVNPDPAQLDFVKKMLSFWQEGYGKEYNEDRSQAMSLIRPVSSLKEIEEEYAKYTLVATSARELEGAIDIKDLAYEARINPEKKYLLLFGTGWGLAHELLESSDFLLKPIKTRTNYNHLPVRSACAIILDRLENNLVK